MPYLLRFFFDPGSGICLWAGDAVTSEWFGYPIELDRLPLTPQTKAAAEELIGWFDESIDWDDPGNLRPWPDEAEFLATARALLERMRDELGADYIIQDELR
jgi:hypothetical protein